ncbi:hypothetical protein RYX36_014017 [Vicia faba]
MKPTYSQGRYKTYARKNAMPQIDLSDEEGYDNETFINVDANKQEDNLGLPGDIGTMTRAKRWMKFYQQLLLYNTQLVKKFYANLVNTNNRSDEVIVRGINVSYSDGLINMFFSLNNNEDRYQELLYASDDRDFDVYMESLCNLGTKWLEYGGDKIMKRMNLRPEAKVWYQFVKHLLRPTIH